MNHLRDFLNDRISVAIGIVFLSMGLIFGTWAAFIPLVKAQFGLDEAQLGLLLLALPAGVTVMNLGSVPLLHRFGAVKVTIVALPLAAAIFIFPYIMPTAISTAGILFIAGGTFSTINMGINTCATVYEEQLGTKILSTCHGLWSVGAMIGAAIGSLMLGFGVQPHVYALVVLVVQVVVIFGVWVPLHLVPTQAHADEANAGSGKRFVMPNKELWLLIILSLCINMTEGTMVDWSSVYMDDVIHADGVIIGLGFSIYAFFMATGRFLGDSFISRHSARKLLTICGFFACTGLIICVLSTGVFTALIGCALVGCGVSLGAPILYAASTRVAGLGQGVGLATMNTFAMIGFMGGPALLGFVAKTYSLPTAFSLVAVFSVVWIVMSRRV